MSIDVSQQTLDVKRENEAELLNKQGVQTVGVGHDDDDNEVIVVGVNKKTPSVESAIPSSINGVNVRVDEVGDIVPELLQVAPERQSRFRPVPQGVSVAHPNVTAGTTGWMYEGGDGTVYLGSNNHVLADINNASVGDAQLQPGPADGGTSDDQVGTLAHYVPVEDGVDVDLAIAEMSANVENSLVGVDAPITGVAGSLAVGDQLVKSGRTTAVTRNTIDQLDVSVDVNYGGDLGTITITGCILTGDMSEGGDSGSPVAKEVSGKLRAAGRLFAGSSSATVHHHIDNELTHLENFDSGITLITDGGDGDTRPTATVTLTLVEQGPGTGDIEVTVEDDSGNPLADADVDITGEGVDQTKKTDAQGFAAFRDITIGSYSILGSKQGYEDDTADITADGFA